MLIIADKRIPEEAQQKLKEYGELVLLETNGITYDAISGHPDIFICQVNNEVIVAPNLPDNYKKRLKESGVNFIEGEQKVGEKFPATASYNIVSTDKFLMHNFRYTDSSITDRSGDLDLIHLNQGYSRCNLLPLKNNAFITSDEGISRILTNYKLEHLYVSPEGIELPGFKHGFIGGACGVWDNKVFILGALKHFNEGEKIRAFLKNQGYEIIELSDGPLYDGGSILFI
jgi:hypothetical protein